MNRYSQVYSQIWFDDKYAELSDAAKLMFLYVLTSPHGNMIGYYRLPVGYAACDLGWDKTDAANTLDELASADMIRYDDKANVILIKHFLKYNPIQNENQAKGAVKLLEDIPPSPLIQKFAECIEQYAGEYNNIFEPVINCVMSQIKNKTIQVQHKDSINTLVMPIASGFDTVGAPLGKGFETLPKGFRNGSERVPKPFGGTKNREQRSVNSEQKTENREKRDISSAAIAADNASPSGLMPIADIAGKPASGSGKTSDNPLKTSLANATMLPKDSIDELFTSCEPGIGFVGSAADENSMPLTEGIDMVSRLKKLRADTVSIPSGNGLDTPKKLSEEGFDTVGKPSETDLNPLPEGFRNPSERVPKPLEDYADDVSAAGRDNTIEQETAQGAFRESTPIPYQQIADLYNSICVSLPKVKTMTDKRRKHIRTCWKELGGDMAVFEQVFRQAEESDFLSGRTGRWTGCNFDWLITYNNMVKVLEGSYRNKTKLPQNLQNALRLVQKTEAGEPVVGNLWEV